MSSRANFTLGGEYPQHYALSSSLTYIWDVPTLSWVKNTGGGGGGGGAATIADGADVAQGTTTDVAWVAGAGTVISLLKKIASAGGSAVSIADGADVAEGATTDAAVITNTTGTVSGKLRGLVKWAFERMPAALGQTTMANSLPVVLASNQSAVGVSILTSPLDVQQVSALPWGVTDAGGSLTVDAPVGTPVFVELSDGAAVWKGQKAMASSLPVVIASDQSAVPVSGPLTDTQLRATPVPVSGTVTASGPLTDVQLRASAVPVSGTVTANQGGAPWSENITQIAGAVPSATNTLPIRQSDGTGFLKSDVIAGARYLGVSLVQDIEVSAVNSSTTNIASAASFTGTSHTTLGVAAIQVCLFADQNCTIQVQQAQEDPGTNWNIVDSWTYTASSTGMDAARTIQAVASSTRVIVTNNGGSTTTAFRLQTVLAPVADSLPRGLTQLGNLKTALVEAIPTGANIIGSVNGDVDHDAVNTLKQIQVAGNASAVDNPPTAVSASGDRVRAWYDRFGAQVVRRRKIRESYTAVFRLAETAARLDQTFTLTANTNKQYATLHHAATATKELQLQMCRVWVTLAGTAVFQGIIELRELSSATPPATGNPAITGRPHRIGTGAHEATALYLPTTQGSEAAVNSPVGSLTFDLGIESATVSTVNPLPGSPDGPAAYTLFDASRMDDQVMAPTAPVGVYGGWAIVFRSTGATVLRATAMMIFTEEIP